MSHIISYVSAEGCEQLLAIQFGHWPYSGYSSEAISSDVYNRSPQPQADVHLIQEIKSQVNSALTAIPKAQVTLIYNISHGR